MVSAFNWIFWLFTKLLSTEISQFSPTRNAKCKETYWTFVFELLSFVSNPVYEHWLNLVLNVVFTWHLSETISRFEFIPLWRWKNRTWFVWQVFIYIIFFLTPPSPCYFSAPGSFISNSMNFLINRFTLFCDIEYY